MMDSREHSGFKPGKSVSIPKTAERLALGFGCSVKVTKGASRAAEPFDQRSSFEIEIKTDGRRGWDEVAYRAQAGLYAVTGHNAFYKDNATGVVRVYVVGGANLIRYVRAFLDPVTAIRKWEASRQFSLAARDSQTLGGAA